ncbi:MULTISPECIES: hypothetical protein [unclassified Halanaerobium]|uniref:hypothetical protein n=1 Tax=unclassified Halanaerobium TaxID=2641197 RepID=UPI000E153FAB|nr:MULTISPECIES: hypothetical protein [unclassified Halanaerobium]RCW44101.1 hypothetical protein DFR78_1212 [Halanaerobium sp. MA284_MarDTE_T2]RCW86959.1 hypothetical protein DER71_10667 [Halanaerobium sp. DL-01]
MVKETSTSKNREKSLDVKKLKKEINFELPFRENIDKLSKKLAADYDIKFNLCQIKGGRRWSYTAGYEGLMVNKRKIKVNDKLGLVVENYSQLNENDWDQFISLIKELCYN